MRFHKVTGSGNDFVVFDVRRESIPRLSDPGLIRALCARRTGVGADGVVLLEPSTHADFRMSYFNSDGSRAAMCGNAALCITRLAGDLGAGKPSGMSFESDSGLVIARVVEGLPEVDLQPVGRLRADVDIPRADRERRIGLAEAGVPHLVVLCDDTAAVDVAMRGAELRNHPSLEPAGANANFVCRRSGRWAMRTFERGVEGETLACGTGAVACAVLLAEWGESGSETSLASRSGETLTVRLTRTDSGWAPTLRGEGRLVFEGQLREL